MRSDLDAGSTIAPESVFRMFTAGYQHRLVRPGADVGDNRLDNLRRCKTGNSASPRALRPVDPPDTIPPNRPPNAGGLAHRMRRHRDEAERDRDHARRERNQAQVDREAAVRDQGVAELDRDQTEEFASVLQRTFLPPSLPEIKGMTVAAFFRPISSGQVGGDFYDVFALGGDQWAFFIGDVLGHGAGAAVVTSLIRYTLRSAALHYSDPTLALSELNSVLLRENEPRRFCTVNYGTVRPRDDGGGFIVTIATGGHPSGLLIDPVSGDVEEIRPSGGTARRRATRGDVRRLQRHVASRPDIAVLRRWADRGTPR